MVQAEKLTAEMELFATKVVSKLRDAGFDAYFAGGCVRDRLLNVVPKDFDVATSAKPQQVREVFGQKRTIAIGQSFGVITVLGPKPQQVEVATFRNDGAYSDGRRPDSVTFSSPEEDAQRRDFTINGMFFDPLTQQVIDYVDGQRDIQARRIRAIGDPAERIEEDRLRMLRAVRFAATYDFDVEEATMSAIRERHQKIASVSQERITHELLRMLAKPDARRRALTLLAESRLLEVVLPSVASVYSERDRWERMLRVAESIESHNSSIVLAGLLGVSGANLSHQETSVVCRKLKLSNEQRKLIEWWSKHASQLQRASELPFSELQPLLIQPEIEPSLKLLEAIAKTDGSKLEHVEHIRAKLALPPAELNPEPLIRGEDLIALGVSPSPKFAHLLSLARAAQLNGEVGNKDQALALLQSEANS